MYYDGPPGMLLDLVGPSPDGVDLVWNHPYSNAGPYRNRPRRARSHAYAYANNNPVNMIDPSGEIPFWAIHLGIELGILALWYGNYCGPGSTLPGPGPIDGLDACCQDHDNCYQVNNAKWWNALPRCGTPATLRCDTNLCNCTRQFNCGNLPVLARPHCYTYRAEVIAYFC